MRRIPPRLRLAITTLALCGAAFLSLASFSVTLHGFRVPCDRPPSYVSPREVDFGFPGNASSLECQNGGRVRLMGGIGLATTGVLFFVWRPGQKRPRLRDLVGKRRRL